MNFGGMNPPAIALAALVALGFSLLYGRLITPSRLSPGTLLVALAAHGLAAWVLAGTLGHLGPGQVTLRNGLISAGFVWAGFTAPALAVSLRRHAVVWRMIVAEAAGWLFALLIAGAVIGGIGT